ncbi:MAG TPA: leucyl aminopeptidase family protein [Pseudogracilibacillus sp.]|nr:leucyl aminopeptidase family protein [Pseudogracilibacillus sp.]
MEKKATILFQVENENVRHFVKDAQGNFVTTMIDDVITFVVKENVKEAASLDKVRMLAGSIARTAMKQKITNVDVSAQQLRETFHELATDDVTIAFVEGWELGTYTFDTYKSKKKAAKPELHVTDGVIASLIDQGKVRAAATAFARDLMNETPSTLTPETFPEILRDTFSDSAVDVVVHAKEQIAAMEMNGLLAVNRGSKYDPAFIELHYRGDESKPLIALVGKGVTFDTGGISLKSGRNLSDMRMDMGGAAAVAGAVKLLAEMNAPVNVVGLIQTVENMPDRHSLLPGDIITYKTGQTVQVGNTDAEGRLILADGLIRAGELEAEYVVDIATLTGAIHFALGPKMGGVFGDDQLMEQVKTLGEQNGDHVWPMPLIEDYERTLNSDYADFCNISNQSYGGAITAALFLRKFVPDNAKWLHIDMAGTMESKTEGYYEAGGTGYGVRLLADFATAVSK